MGNIFSYIRIAAVGVGGLIIAETINNALLPRFDTTPTGFLIFILVSIVYLALHLAACVVAMFESIVHGARLNMVEFFRKFYKGNGLRFSPFSANRRFTLES